MNNFKKNCNEYFDHNKKPSKMYQSFSQICKHFDTYEIENNEKKGTNILSKIKNLEELFLYFLEHKNLSLQNGIS